MRLPHSPVANDANGTRNFRHFPGDGRTTSGINNTTDFQLKKQRLSKLRKEKLSKSKPTKVTTFLPESQRFKMPFVIKVGVRLRHPVVAQW
jgi:hypothetical protein